MSKIGRRFGLPLLAKELTELANRRRTYVLRTIYACVFLLLAYLRYESVVAKWQNAFGNAFSFGMLGYGRFVFEEVVQLQLGAIYLFMPAMVCGARPWRCHKPPYSPVKL